MLRLFVFLSLMFPGLHPNAQNGKGSKAWVFSYFKGNGEDGLHMAYSKDGYTWNLLDGDSSFLRPTAGHDKLMRDPCVIRGGDGKFYMVWTVSWGERSIGYASSDDLLHWSTQQTLPVMDIDSSALNAWAPEIFYDAAGKDYMIYWASTIPGKFAMKGVNPKDKYNHRIYYVLTKDFKTFTKAKLLYDKGFSVIDATIQKNGKKYIMFLKNENDNPIEKNLRIATSNKLSTGYSRPSTPITGKYWAEGPTVLRMEGKWIVYFDKYTQHAYGAVESADLKNWIDVSDKISLPKGIRHGTILELTSDELDLLIKSARGKNKNDG